MSRRYDTWPPHGWYPHPRQTMAQRAGRAVAAGAGRAAIAGLGHVHTQRRAAFPALLALTAHVVAAALWVLLRLHLAHRSWVWWTDAAAAVGVAMAIVWPWRLETVKGRRRVYSRGLRPRVLRWRPWRRAWLATATTMLLTYLPVTALWLPPWHGLGHWWLPMILPTTLVSAALWAWLYVGHYRVREVVEEEPEDDYGPAEVWAEEIAAPGKLLPGSRLTAVRDIKASA